MSLAVLGALVATAMLVEAQSPPRWTVLTRVDNGRQTWEYDGASVDSTAGAGHYLATLRYSIATREMNGGWSQVNVGGRSVRFDGRVTPVEIDCGTSRIRGAGEVAYYLGSVRLSVGVSTAPPPEWRAPDARDGEAKAVAAFCRERSRG